jgi:hypothetical protein
MFCSTCSPDEPLLAELHSTTLAPFSSDRKLKYCLLIIFLVLN